MGVVGLGTERDRSATGLCMTSPEKRASSIARSSFLGQAFPPIGLWTVRPCGNAAELSEKRKDARVGREFEIALPHELSAEGRLEATRAFAQDLADRYGAAVDFAIHAPHDASDVRNHHAHVMMTTRQVGEDVLGDKTYPFWIPMGSRMATNRQALRD